MPGGWYPGSASHDQTVQDTQVEAAGLVCEVTLLHSVGEGQVQELRPLVEALIDRREEARLALGSPGLTEVVTQA